MTNTKLVLLSLGAILCCTLIVIIAALTLVLITSKDSGSGAYMLNDDTIITLERTPCFGFCPVYTLTVFGDGNAEFEGEMNVTQNGKLIKYKVTESNLKKLMTEFEKVSFFNLENEYIDLNITDIPGLSIGLTNNGKSKNIEVFDYEGSEVEKLQNLADKIDELMQTNGYTEYNPAQEEGDEPIGGFQNNGPEADARDSKRRDLVNEVSLMIEEFYTNSMVYPQISDFTFSSDSIKLDNQQIKLEDELTIGTVSNETQTLYCYRPASLDQVYMFGAQTENIQGFYSVWFEEGEDCSDFLISI